MDGFPNFIYDSYDQPKHFPKPIFLTIKFVFYLYVKVLLANIVCFDLILLCWIPMNVTCIIMILGTL